ncbi:MAG: hypothetical protein PHS14_00370 [Elusimicrobia bacterium]|nr:hypothetical protein [Elusimicrobiota bacterium]
MKLRAARKIAVTRTQRRGTVLRALARLPWGEYVAVNRWWRWGRLNARLKFLGEVNS